jgi:GT2 family glycosyltransferase
MTLLAGRDAHQAPERDPSNGLVGASLAQTVVVIIPTLGRAELTTRTVERLSRQSHRPHRVIVVGVTPADVVGLEALQPWVEVHFAPKGSCSQRNFAIDLVEGEADILAFFDDDFVPSDDFFAQAVRLFATHDDIVGACGRIIADGASGPGISFEDAVALVEAARTARAEPFELHPRRGLYGCNMVFRASAIQDARFDERLPLYGWQEDFDFSRQLAARGRLVRCSGLSGVHMGVKLGRSSGKKFGYSQIANPVYLHQKGSMPSSRALRLIRDNLLSNIGRCLWPERYIDRRGRLRGNLSALFDLFTGRIDPLRVLEMD